MNSRAERLAKEKERVKKEIIDAKPLADIAVTVISALVIYKCANFLNNHL